MQEGLPQLATLALTATIIAAWIGSKLDRFGVVMLGAPAALFSVVCIAAGFKWGWPAALAAVLVIEIIVIWKGKAIFQSSGVISVSVLWIWYAAIGALVYLNKTWFGLFAIALPAFVILWGGLFLFSGSILPVKGAEQRMQAFRSLLTFTLGTNFPYFIIQDWKKEGKPIPRVDGNPYSRYLSGPGIVLTSCDHLVVTTTRLKSNLVQPPGLTFTKKYEEIQAVVDLRPQLRAFTTQAETKDGIPIEMLSFWPCKIDSGRRQPGWRDSYPYNYKSVFNAVYRQPQGHEWERDEKGTAHEELKKIDWDDILPKTIAPPIIKKIILDYTCDQLCAPGDPRIEIKQKIKKQLEDALRPLGIQVVGGGISDIVPSEKVIEQRIENWKARWQKEIDAELGRLKADKAKYTEETVRARVKLEMLKNIAREISPILDDETMSQQMIALCFAEAMQEMMDKAPATEKMSDDSVKMYAEQRSRLGG